MEEKTPIPPFYSHLSLFYLNFLWCQHACEKPPPCFGPFPLLVHHENLEMVVTAIIAIELLYVL